MIRMLLPLAAMAVAIAVYAPPAAARQTKTTPPAAKAIDINTASAAEFEALPGIGAKTAARIVEYRQKNGPFKKFEDVSEARASTSLPTSDRAKGRSTSG
jgi:competence ComEA-like helix-hairpin-helix protein